MNLIKWVIVQIVLFISILLILISIKKKINKKYSLLSKKSIIDFFTRYNKNLSYQKPVPIRSKSYGKKNNYYLYSPVLVQKKNSIMIQPVRRIEDKNSRNPYRLEKFSMISVSLDKKDMGKTLNMFGNFFKNYCKLDMRKLGCVSINGSNDLDIEGIEKYYDLLEKWGIDKKNIYIRNAMEAVKDGEGDGYWIYPDPDFDHLKGWTISFHYQLATKSDISSYKNNKNWIEIAEISEIIGAVGYERIKLIMGL